jgi:hypothetical protein
MDRILESETFGEREAASVSQASPLCKAHDTIALNTEYVALSCLLTLCH